MLGDNVSSGASVSNMLLALAGAEVRQVDFELSQLDRCQHALAGSEAGNAVTESQIQKLQRRKSGLVIRKLQALRYHDVCYAVQFIPRRLTPRCIGSWLGLDGRLLSRLQVLRRSSSSHIQTLVRMILSIETMGANPRCQGCLSEPNRPVTSRGCHGL